jgi:hypothetical protein
VSGTANGAATTVGNGANAAANGTASGAANGAASTAPKSQPSAGGSLLGQGDAALSHDLVASPAVQAPKAPGRTRARTRVTRIFRSVAHWTRPIRARAASRAARAPRTPRRVPTRPAAATRK